METAFEGQPGVTSVVSGFAGGGEKNVTYEQVSAGETGHAESVRVRYDPTKTTYARLLDLYWHNIDPFSSEGQFCDRGHQYRSAIFYLDDAQKKAAEESKRTVEAQLQAEGGDRDRRGDAVLGRPRSITRTSTRRTRPATTRTAPAAAATRACRQVWGDKAGHSAVH